MRAVFRRVAALAGIALLTACAITRDADAAIARRKTENADAHSARCTIAGGRMTRVAAEGMPRYECTNTAADKACAEKHGPRWVLKNEGEPGAKCEPPAAAQQ